MKNKAIHVEMLEQEATLPEDPKISLIQQLRKKSVIIMIIGKRDSGKTALGFRLMENLKPLTKRELCTVDYPEKTPFNNYDDISNVPKGAIALIDEGSKKYDARRAMSAGNISMSNELKIARHNDISIIYITQNTADIEVRTLRMADIFLLKEPSLVQEYFERSIVKQIYQHIAPVFSNKQINHCPFYYIFSDKLRGLFQFSLPSFWSEEISKAYRKKENSVVPDLFEDIQGAKT